MDTIQVITTALVIFLCLALCVLPAYGYVANIVKLCGCDFEAPFKAEAIRIVGIVVGPVGMVVGFCDIDD